MLKELFKKCFEVLQQMGKALMLPVSVLPVAGILLGIGSSKFSWIPQEQIATLIQNGEKLFSGLPFWTALGASILKIMATSGDAIFANLPMLFAIGVALGLTKNDGVAALAAVVGYLVMLATMGVMAQVRGLAAMVIDAGGDLEPASTNITNEIVGITSIDTGVFGGILIGALVGYLFNKYYRIQLPPYLGFFAGKRFVPIITAAGAIIMGSILSYVWPPIGDIIRQVGDWAANSNTTLAVVVYGVVERALLPFGLHHIWNAPFFFEMGSFTDATGEVIHGDMRRFFAGDPTAGIMGGGFLFKMWGLPAAAIAIWHCAKKERKVEIGGIMMSAALTSFLTGITEPIEFSFLFLAPALYAIHACLAGLAYYLISVVGAHLGYTFSHGFIDYLLYFSIDTKPYWVFILGPVYAVIYYSVFRFVITFWNLPTPGREKNGQDAKGESAVLTNDKPARVVRALGGRKNIDSLDACITRLRVVLNDSSKANPDELKALGAAGVVMVGDGLQAIFGTSSENLKSDIEEYLRTTTEDLPALPQSPQCTNNVPNKALKTQEQNEKWQKAAQSQEMQNAAAGILEALGTPENIKECKVIALTRVKLLLNDTSLINRDKLALLNYEYMEPKEGVFHIIADTENAPILNLAIKGNL